MKIAIPVQKGLVSTHFGHCEEFLITEVDPDNKTVIGEYSMKSPPHQPGFLPQWLSNEGVEVIIASGMGHKAQTLFSQKEIIVVVGAPVCSPKNVITAFLNGSLESGENTCDH